VSAGVVVEMMRVSSNQVGQLQDQTVKRMTSSALPWLRSDHPALVNEISDPDLLVKVEKIVQFALNASVAQERNVRSIIVFHLEKDSEPTKEVAHPLQRPGFTEHERVAAYIIGSKQQRTKVKLDSILPATGGSA